jgi:hypothetical protein
MMSGGYVVNVGDFSGVHSGVVFGICNTICKSSNYFSKIISFFFFTASIGGFCAPYITSIITRHVCIPEKERVLRFDFFSFI